MRILLIFIAIPILEIALFIQVGGFIGLWPTLAIVVLTAIVGTTVMRIQGLQAIDRLRGSLESGRDPVGPIAHGALILVAGVLLLTPGFFTDALGFALLVPRIRSLLIGWGASRLTVRAAGVVNPRRSSEHASTATIDADYEVLEEQTPPGAGSSGWTRRDPSE